MSAHSDALSLVLVALGAPGAILMSVISFLGLYHQGQTVWRTRSAHNLSAGLFMALVAVFLTGAAYGMAYQRPLMVAANLARAPLAVLIFVGIMYFGRVTWRALMFVIPLSLLAALPFFLPRYANACTVAAGMVATLCTAAQIARIIVSKSTGELSFAFALSTFLNALFWMLYLSNGDWALVALCASNVALSGTLVFVFWRYRPNPETALEHELVQALTSILRPLALWQKKPSVP